jgi:hypothetical protein
MCLLLLLVRLLLLLWRWCRSSGLPHKGGSGVAPRLLMLLLLLWWLAASIVLQGWAPGLIMLRYIWHQTHHCPLVLLLVPPALGVGWVVPLTGRAWPLLLTLLLLLLLLLLVVVAVPLRLLLVLLVLLL